MSETHVVTVFLRNRSEVLLLRRSDEVGSYPGRWGAVAGHAEGDPDALARQEIREETGIEMEQVSLVRRGEPFAVNDEDYAWVVHPYLFDCETRAVEPNWETAEYEWASPTAILRRETVPDLWTSYRRVAPTVDTVREDREHGSAFLSVRALEVLRDRAARGAERGEYDWGDLAAVARELRDARAGMAAIRNRVNRAMDEAREERTPEAVEEAVSAELTAAITADDDAARVAAGVIGDRVLTLSRSGTVRAALREGAPTAVTVAESRPGGEGVSVAADLAPETDVTLTVDANLPGAVADVECVLVGADSVRPDGAVVNKVGTRAAALAAAREDIPCYAVCARDKIDPDPGGGPVDAETGDPTDLYDGDAEITVDVPLFERVPGDLIDGVVTEAGVLDADEIAAVAEDFRTLAGWDGE